MMRIKYTTLFMIFMALVFSRSMFAASGDTALYALPTEVGTSARAIRLGNIEGFSSFSSSVLENPAGLYRVRKASTSFFTTKFMDEVRYLNGSVAVRMPVGVLGLGYAGVGVGGIKSTEVVADEFVPTGETFGLNKSTFKLAYQVSVSQYLHLGACADYYTYTLGKVSAKGYNSDIGLILDTNYLDFSFVAKNVFTSLPMRYTDKSDDLVVDGADNNSTGKQEKLPFQTAYSARVPLGQFQLYGQLRTEGTERRFVKSAGVNYNPRFLPFFHISGGYKETHFVRSVEAQLDKDNVRGGFVAGIGLDLYNISFDYAYEKSEHIEFENKHYFSIGLSF